MFCLHALIWVTWKERNSGVLKVFQGFVFSLGIFRISYGELVKN